MKKMRVTSKWREKNYYERVIKPARELRQSLIMQKWILENKITSRQYIKAVEKMYGKAL